MRVAYLNQDPGIAPGRKKGAAVHVAALQGAMRALGADVVAIEAKTSSEALRALKDAHAARALDLVYERYALDAHAGAQFAHEFGVPLFLEVNAPLLDEARERRGADLAPASLDSERFVFRTAAELFPVSQGVAEYIARHDIEPERIHVTPNGVDNDAFRQGRARPRDLSLPGGAFVLGFHGRLRPWHNFGLVADAVARLVTRGHAVHVLAIGEGDFAAHFAPELRASHLTALPWMEPERLAHYVACMHALPLSYAPSSTCYFSPLKLLEAMACGVVPLVPELGDLPAAVDLGRCGIVYPAGDACALSDAIAGLIEWPEVRERLSRNAVVKARSRTWTHVAREVLAHCEGARVA